MLPVKKIMNPLEILERERASKTRDGYIIGRTKQSGLPRL